MLSLYTEVAVQAAPVLPALIVRHHVPRKQSAFNKTPQKKDGAFPRSIEEYSKTFLASSAGAHFNGDQTSTNQAYIWRVTNDDTTLQIRPAALTKDDQDDEAHLTLHLEFLDQIREHTVGFADSTEDNNLEIFACTNKNEVHHLTIPAAAFRRSDALNGDTSQWHSLIETSSLTIDTVFRLQVHSANEVFLCFTSGKIQYLTRKSGSNKWEGITYDDKTWGASLNSLIGRGISRKLEYGSSYVDSRTAQTVQASADSTYLYTVCLNHQLRVWHIPTGRMVVAKDLLDHEGDDQGRTLSAFDRGHLQHLQGVEMRGSILVTYSPRDGGQFKFWDVRGGLTDTLTVSDRYPGTKLTPPDPDPTGTTVWSMVGFRVIPQGELDARGSARLWVLWRNNNHHKTYSLQFDLDDIGRAWPDHNWVTSTTNSGQELIPDFVSSGVEDPTSQWLDYLTIPGRYPNEVLETALNIYNRHIKTSQDSSLSLQRRLCDAIAPTARLKKQEGGSMSFESFAYEIDQAWRNFYRTVEKINETRHGPLAFAYESDIGLPLLVMSDEIAVLRESTKLDLVLHNEPESLQNLESISSNIWPHRSVGSDERGISYASLSQLLSSAQRFTDDFPSELIQGLDSVIADMLFLNAEQALPSRILEAYEDLGFNEAVSDDAFHKLENNFKPLGGIETLNNDVILAALDLLFHRQPQNGLEEAYLKTILGSQIEYTDVLQALTTIRQTLWNLVALVIFVEGELNQEEGAKLANFDAAELFSAMTPHMKTIERNVWLAKHFRSAPLSDKATTLSRTSVLEDSLLKKVPPRHNTTQPTSNLLMMQLHDVLEFLSVEDSGYDLGTVGLLCDMLRREEYELASAFAQYLPMNAWATYVRGRLALARKQYDRAEQYFHQASFGLAHGKVTQSLVTLSFGYIGEEESDSFYNGSSRYFHHVTTLFEAADAHAQCADFARVTLKSQTTDQRMPWPTFRSDTLRSLFNANLNLLRFRAAFDTLTQFTDTETAKLCATTLIDKLLNADRTVYTMRDAVTMIRSFPWSLHPAVASQLNHKLDLLAKAQKSIPDPPRRQTTNGHNRLSSIPVNDAAAPDYLQTVHAVRLAQGDHRGAMAALFERLRLVQRHPKARSDPQATAVRHALLGLINVMTCVPPEEAYILTDADEESTRQGRRSAGNDDEGINSDENRNKRVKRRRIIVTLADVRRQYQQVLDQCSRVERGDFGFSDEEGEESEDDEVMGDSSAAEGNTIGMRDNFRAESRGTQDEAMQIDGGGGGQLDLSFLQNGAGGSIGHGRISGSSGGMGEMKSVGGLLAVQ